MEYGTGFIMLPSPPAALDGVVSYLQALYSTLNLVETNRLIDISRLKIRLESDEPPDPVPGLIWLDTDDGTVYVRNEDNTGWYTVGTGASGTSGYSGRSGYSGMSGWSGLSGWSGSGVSGYSGEGTSGYSGMSGWSGISGWSGLSGWSGRSGWSGVSGWSGWSGLSGWSGWSGLVGAPGATGAKGDPPWYNVKTYGAVGDGVTDDTSAVQDAVDAAIVDGGCVYFPTGTYKLTSEIDVDGICTILGEDRSSTILKFYGCNGLDLNYHQISLEGFILWDGDGDKTGTGITLNAVYGAPWAHIFMKNIWVYGFNLGMDISYCWESSFVGVTVSEGRYGVSVTGQSVNIQWTGCSLQSVLTSAGTYSVKVATDGSYDPEGITFGNCLMFGGETAVRLETAPWTFFNNCIIDGADVTGVYISGGASGIKLIGNYIYTAGTGTAYGIYIAAIVGATSVGSTITGNYLRAGGGAASTGIYVGANNEHNVIKENTLIHFTTCDVSVNSSNNVIGPNTHYSSGKTDKDVYLTALGNVYLPSVLSDGMKSTVHSFVRAVLPGTNTLSAAAAAMQDGDTLVLQAGTYTQTVPVTIPATVNNYGIVGQGSGGYGYDNATLSGTVIRFTAAVDGITKSTADAAYRSCHVLLQGFTMVYDVNSSGAGLCGIMVWGNSGMSHNQPMVTLRDIQLTYGASVGNNWEVGVDLIDCREFLIDNCRLRKESNSFVRAGVLPTNTGFRFQSCMGGEIVNSVAWWYEKNFHLTKASDALIKDATKHGCEGIYVTNCHASYGRYGFVLGYKSFACHFKNIGIAENAEYAIWEDTASGTENSGYHTFDGIYTDIGEGAWEGDSPLVESTHVIFLRMPGTIVRNGTINLEGKNANGVVIDSGSGADADYCIVGGLIFRDGGGGGSSCVWSNASQNSIIEGNIFLGTNGAGYDITVGAGSNQTLIHGNQLDIAVNDAGTDTAQYDNLEH